MAQSTFIPPSWSYNKETKVYSQNDGLTLYKHELSSEHFDVYYGTGYGNTPPEKLASSNALYVNVSDLLKKAEAFYDLNINKLKFADLSITSKLNSYKMIICILHDTGWTATGSGYDNKIGALWITPSTCHPVGQTIAHEIGHAFQYQVYCDLGKNTGFRTSIGNGSTFWEQTAQWQSVMSYPEYKWDQSWAVFKNTSNYAMTHEWMRYQSYWWHYYLAEKYGVEIVGKIWRHNMTSAGDPNEVYMDLMNYDSDALYKEYFDYAMKMATIDLDVARDEAANNIDTYTYNYVPLGGTKYQVAYSSCPQSTGFNVIKLNVPAAGTEVTTEFTSPKSPVMIAQGDALEYFDGDGKYSKLDSKSYYNVNSKYNAQRAFRLGYVALLNDGTRQYLYEDKLYCAEGASGDRTEKVSCIVPENTKSLYFVVAPTPKTYIQHKWDENIANDDQWPYIVEFENTNISGVPTISDDLPISDATITYDVYFAKSSQYFAIDVKAVNDAASVLGTAFQMQPNTLNGKMTQWNSTGPKSGKIMFYAVNADGKISNTGSSANGYGHWFNASGNRSDYASGYLYSEFNPSSLTFSLGQYPGKLTNNKDYTIRQALKYNDGVNTATVTFVFNIHITSEKTCYELTSVKQADVVTGVDGMKSEKKTVTAGSEMYYSVGGRLLSKPQRGVNIVKSSDGTMRKVIVGK